MYIRLKKGSQKIPDTKISYYVCFGFILIFPEDVKI